MSTTNIIRIKIKQNSINLNQEFKRLFHGRGEIWKEFKFLTIDSIDTILSVAFYIECSKNIEKDIITILKEYILTSRHDTIIIQKRYIKGTTTQILIGKLSDENFAIENNIKIKLNLYNNQNNGYFPDMKNGRKFIKSIAKDKKVLNLFSYTCAFSLFAISGGAKSVINIDMAKGALSTGRTNHHINNLSTKNVKFFPYNILKSFSRIKKYGPYDIVIIDPPTFQKGSFEATKDYTKIIKRLEDISIKDTVILACLNSPHLDANFIIDIFKTQASSFKFIKRLENVKEFEALDEQRSLKNLIFKRD